MGISLLAHAARSGCAPASAGRGASGRLRRPRPCRHGPLAGCPRNGGTMPRRAGGPGAGGGPAVRRPAGSGASEGPAGLGALGMADSPASSSRSGSPGWAGGFIVPWSSRFTPSGPCSAIALSALPPPCRCTPPEGPGRCPPAPPRRSPGPPAAVPAARDPRDRFRRDQAGDLQPAGTGER